MCLTILGRYTLKGTSNLLSLFSTVVLKTTNYLLFNGILYNNRVLFIYQKPSDKIILVLWFLLLLWKDIYSVGDLWTKPITSQKWRHQERPISKLNNYQNEKRHTPRKISKYGVFSGRYFTVFALNKETKYQNGACCCIEKIRTKKNSVFTFQAVTPGKSPIKWPSFAGRMKIVIYMHVLWKKKTILTKT